MFTAELQRLTPCPFVQVKSSRVRAGRSQGTQLTHCKRLRAAAPSWPSHCHTHGPTSRRAGLARPRCTATIGSAPDVVLTRERGKNDTLAAELRRRGVHVLELPLIESAPGPDRDVLVAALRESAFDWVAITSPEAAAVFVQAWRRAGEPAVRIAVVGKGSGLVFEDLVPEGTLKPAFTPSKANALHMSAELPVLEGGSMRVLYPASVKAGSELQGGLEARGFTVARLNTYTTVAVSCVDPEHLALAKQARVVAIASPSAVKAWVHLVGQETAECIGVAGIGSTSGKAALDLDLKNVIWTERPGLEGFADSIMTALKMAAPL